MKKSNYISIVLMLFTINLFIILLYLRLFLLENKIFIEINEKFSET